MNIVVLDGYTLNPGDLSWEEFESRWDITVYDRTPEDKIVERIGDAEIVLTNKAQITKEVIDACPKMKYVGVLATGYNIVDTEYAAKKEVVVTNIPGYSGQTVAGFVFALMLELAINVGEYNRTVHEGQWQNCDDFMYYAAPLSELHGKTLGIFGYGDIGQQVSNIAHAFGMNVLVNSRTNPDEEERENWKFVDFDTMVEKSDFITIHTPLTEETEGKFNKDVFKQMKKGAYLINTSRGPVINEADLRDVLNEGHLAGAAADVVSVEPIEADNPLLEADNMILTPHIAWASKEARLRLIDICVENIEKYIEGNPINRVN